MSRVVRVSVAVAFAVAGFTVAMPPAGAFQNPQFTPGLQLVAQAPYGLFQAEPSIRVDSGGRIYVIAPATQPIGCEFWTVAPGARSAVFHTPPDLSTGGGDCDLAVSNAPEPGAAYPTVSYSSLALADLTVGKSTDGGATFTVPNVVGSQIVGDDRQWNAAGEGSTVYMSYHIVETNNIAVARSTDGGQTYLFRGLAIDAAHIAQAIYNNELGPIVVDMHSVLSPKPIYTIFTAPPTAAENLNTAVGTLQTANHAVYLASSYDGGATWTDTPIYVGPNTETYDHIFPSLGVDAAGGLWAAWASASHIYAAYAAPSVTGTFVWTPPMQIDNTGANANVFPWIVGGGQGFADLVWYGGSGANSDDPTNQWVVRLAQLRYQQGAGLSIMTQSVASDHVIHTGQICTLGELCSVDGNRTLLDFFQIALTPDGRGTIAWADDSAQAGIPQIFVTQQCSGLSATTGLPVANSC